jgi:hypothetical protein
MLEEAQNISSTKVKELIGSFQTFELAINERSEKKNKSIVFNSNTDDDEIQCDMETNEGISNAIVDLGRKFNKVLKMMDRKPGPNVENMSFDISNNSDVQRKARTKEKPNQGKGEPDEETAKHVHYKKTVI